MNNICGSYVESLEFKNEGENLQIRDKCSIFSHMIPVYPWLQVILY